MLSWSRVTLLCSWAMTALWWECSSFQLAELQTTQPDTLYEVGLLTLVWHHRFLWENGKSK